MATDFTVSTKYLAGLFEKSAKTISVWKNTRGLDVAFISAGKWDLRSAIQWWAESEHYPKNNSEISDSRERWEKARADKIEIDVDRMRSELLPAENVQQALAELISVTKRAFLLLPHQLPTLLAGKDPGEHKDILEGAVDEILKGMAERASFKEIRKRIT